MAGSGDSPDLQNFLKPFDERASEAEERLSKLEALLACKKDAGNEDLPKIVSDRQGKLEDAKASKEAAENAKLAAENATLAAENVKLAAENVKIAAENAKLQYQKTHLVQALREALCKLENQTK
ncbi:hypothetical protein NE237_004672 [Protea cynaroides]|uniref:Uncharacterized protein n=1 Tax=Protea cynaroides TaxID=273540 RepID=A0A9Q0KJ40_9MAGN|nr:hypothetical protein NE237_004672 [Protea cynaroides]